MRDQIIRPVQFQRSSHTCRISVKVIFDSIDKPVHPNNIQLEKAAELFEFR